MSTVALIVPCCNDAEHLDEALDSALGQTFHDIDVVVVDDGSTDGSREVVERCVPQVRLIRQSNRGPSSARSAGIRGSDSDYVAFLDADDLIDPRTVELQVGLLNEQSEVGIVHTDMKRFDGQGWVEDFVVAPDRVAQGTCWRALFLGDTLCGASVMTRRKVLAALIVRGLRAHGRDFRRLLEHKARKR